MIAKTRHCTAWPAAARFGGGLGVAAGWAAGGFVCGGDFGGEVGAAAYWIFDFRPIKGVEPGKDSPGESRGAAAGGVYNDLDPAELRVAG
jgi:hypothetical protein